MQTLDGLNVLQTSLIPQITPATTISLSMIENSSSLGNKKRAEAEEGCLPLLALDNIAHRTIAILWKPLLGILLVLLYQLVHQLRTSVCNGYA